MCRRFLWLAALATIYFGFALLARADSTNAAIPYKAMDELCQIASGADQTKLKVEVYVSSANKAVPSSNITLMIQSATQGKIPVTVGTNGQILNFPHRKELVRENPFILANQPKGTLHLSLHYQIPLPEELTFRYARLGDGVAEANKMIKAQAGMMSMFAPKVEGAVFVFPKESAARAKVKILSAAGPQEFVADDKGLVKLKLEKSMIKENPEVQLLEKPKVVLPDIN
jgi:hypothetical protein